MVLAAGAFGERPWAWPERRALGALVAGWPWAEIGLYRKEEELAWEPDRLLLEDPHEPYD